MAVSETTDAFLFLQVSENELVILKYHTDDCGAVCQEFIPIYEEISENPRYKDVIFLTINAENNPVAKRRILDVRQPVMTIYSKGRLLDSRHTSTREGVEQLLHELMEKV
jgi:thioredoxin 1